MTKKERYQYVIDFFSTQMLEAETELNYNTAFELLVAVILSAQCTDKRVNMVTPSLFKKFPNSQMLAQAEFEQVFEIIRSISYPNNKAKHLIGMARLLESDYGGEIPLEVKELIKLPGVGRKTANVITSVLDHQPNMAVDTHVYRVSARIGLTKGATTPLATEKQLIKYIPKDLVHKAHHWLILHGRYICTARNPKCEECGIKAACIFYNK